MVLETVVYLQFSNHLTWLLAREYFSDLWITLKAI